MVWGATKLRAVGKPQTDDRAHAITHERDGPRCSDADPRLSPAAYEYLRWAADDFCELFVLRDVLRRLAGDLKPIDEKDAALVVLSELLNAELVRVGDMSVDTPGLAYWDLAAPEALARIAAAWNDHHPPEMGHGPWLDATPTGKTIAAERSG